MRFWTNKTKKQKTKNKKPKRKTKFSDLYIYGNRFSPISKRKKIYIYCPKWTKSFFTKYCHPYAPGRRGDNRNCTRMGEGEKGTLGTAQRPNGMERTGRLECCIRHTNIRAETYKLSTKGRPTRNGGRVAYLSQPTTELPKITAFVSTRLA